MPRYNPALLPTDELRDNMIDFATEKRRLQFNYDGCKFDWDRDTALQNYENTDKYFNKCQRLRAKMRAIENKRLKTRLEIMHRETNEFLRELHHTTRRVAV